jgi:hypothetical protein
MEKEQFKENKMKKEGQKNKEKICKREEVLSVVAEGEK